MGSGKVEQEGSSEKKTSPGKAAILALGKAFPHQLVMQEFLVDGYFRNTNCDDPDLKEKLTRLCNLSHPSLLQFLSSFYNLVIVIINNGIVCSYN